MAHGGQAVEDKLVQGMHWWSSLGAQQGWVEAGAVVFVFEKP